MCEHKIVTVYTDDTHTEISHFRCVRCGGKIEIPNGYNKAIENISKYMDNAKGFTVNDGAMMLYIVFDLPKEVALHDLGEYIKNRLDD